MTLDEAKRVAEVCATVDNGCVVCVRNMVDELNKEFPEFAFIFDDAAAPTIKVCKRQGETK